MLFYMYILLYTVYNIKTGGLVENASENETGRSPKVLLCALTSRLYDFNRWILSDELRFYETHKIPQGLLGSDLKPSVHNYTNGNFICLRVGVSTRNFKTKSRLVWVQILFRQKIK